MAAEVSYNNAWYTFDGGLGKKAVNAKSYTPFGEQIGEATSGFGYNGEYYNAVTDQIYLRARFYAPEMNRFSQKDTLRGTVSNPQSLNRYAYCINDPINLVDSSGESVKGFLNTVKTAATAAAKTVVTAKAVVSTTAKQVVKTAAQTAQMANTAVKTTVVTTAAAVSRSVVTSTVNKSGLRTTVAAAAQAAKSALKTGSAVTVKVINDGLKDIKQTANAGKEIVKTVVNSEIQKVKEAAKDVDWQKAARIAMITASVAETAGGIALLATGVGSAAGAALLGAGVSSLAGGFISDAQGGSFFSGWTGGELSGGLTGGGIGLGEVLGLSFAGTELLALGGGFTGGTIGSFVTQGIESGRVDIKDAINDGLVNGLFSGVAGVFGQVPMAIRSAGAGAIGRVMSSGISLINEVVFDGFSSYFTSTNGFVVTDGVPDAITNALYSGSVGIIKTACTR